MCPRTTAQTTVLRRGADRASRWTGPASAQPQRGYPSFRYLRAMLYFTGSNFEIPVQPLFHGS
ncbi:MAG: hypothetical protein ACLFU2_02475 [Opitutales bacterium]